MLNHECLKAACKDGGIMLSKHIKERCKERNISIDDVLNVLMNGNIIKQYEDDTPFPSCLINGVDMSGVPCHAVAAYDALTNAVCLVTTYRPNVDLWTEDFTVKL